MPRQTQTQTNDREGGKPDDGAGPDRLIEISGFAMEAIEEQRPLPV